MNRTLRERMKNLRSRSRSRSRGRGRVNAYSRRRGIPRLSRAQWASIVSVYNLTPRRIRVLQGVAEHDPELAGFSDFLKGAMKFVEGGLGQVTGSTAEKEQLQMQQNKETQLAIIEAMKDKKNKIDPKILYAGGIAGALLLILVLKK